MKAPSQQRASFLASIDSGKEVSEMVFLGELSGFTGSDRAWLRREVSKGRIVKRRDCGPFFKWVYSRPWIWSAA